MTREEFISELELMLDVKEGVLNCDTELASIRSWDSIGKLSMLTLISDIGTEVEIDLLRDCKTINDLLKLVEDDLE